MPETTTITVTDSVWKRLNERKERGETFNDLVREMLDATHEPPTDTEQAQTQR